MHGLSLSSGTRGSLLQSLDALAQAGAWLLALKQAAQKLWTRGLGSLCKLGWHEGLQKSGQPTALFSLGGKNPPRLNGNISFPEVINLCNFLSVGKLISIFFVPSQSEMTEYPLERKLGDSIGSSCQSHRLLPVPCVFSPPECLYVHCWNLAPTRVYTHSSQKHFMKEGEY